MKNIEGGATPPADNAEELMDFLGWPRQAKFDFWSACLDVMPVSYWAKVVEARLQGSELESLKPISQPEVSKFLRRIGKPRKPLEEEVQDSLVFFSKRLGLPTPIKTVDELLGKLPPLDPTDAAALELTDQEEDQLIRDALGQERDLKRRAVPYLAHGLTVDVMLKHPMTFIRSMFRMVHNNGEQNK